MAWWTPLPVAAWLVLVAAAWLDPGHDLRADYVSWLSHGPYAWPAAIGILGLVVSTALAARRVHDAVEGRLGHVATAFLWCGVVLGLATVAFPSRGLNEPLWRTTLHVALAVGAYECIAVPALLLAWRSRLGLVPRHFTGWAAGIVLALAALAITSAVATFTDGPQLRGMAQLGLVGAGAGWLAAASTLNREGPRPSHTPGPQRAAPRRPRLQR